MCVYSNLRFSARVAYVMRTENQSNGRAHGCDRAQIFCLHGFIHAHRKSRVMDVCMAMCTSTPIIDKDATYPKYPIDLGLKKWIIWNVSNAFNYYLPDFFW